MSLASLLLKSTHSVDSELDALFKSQPVTTPSKKRKPEDDTQEIRTKRSKIISQRDKASPTQTSSNKVLNQKQKQNEDSDGGGDSNSDLETSYLRERVKPLTPNEDLANNGVSDDDEDDEEGDPSKLVHESLTSKAKLKRGPKQKYTPPDESLPQRDQRTIFVGNLPLQVAQKRPLQKQLQRHILSFVPTAKIESIRFRSVPFSTPTTLPSSTSTTSDPKSSSPLPHKKNPSQREHDRSRASSWQQHHTSPDDTPKDNEKQYLNPHQKKKIAFIHQEFHTTADTVHAYIVFSHPIPQESRPKNLPPLDPVMDPYEAAKEAVRKADGSVFMERMIRVDFVGKNSSGQKGGGEGEGEVDTPLLHPNNNDAADPKSTLFIGNLDLASKEEDVRVFFETLMQKERGEPEIQGGDGGENTSEEASTKKLRKWVVRVRIIRDKDTQLGKGFGYVQFIDRECIDEILNMEPSQLKFAKRKLRVQRCKTIPGTKPPSSVKLSTNANVTSSTPKSQSKSKSTEKPNPRTRPSTSTPITIPKGDPTLGTKLVNLTKEERKKAKASDADRIARRLAKKKARMAMNVPSKDRALLEGKGDRTERKRERVRKGVAGIIGGKKPVSEKKARRVRSEKSLEKRNVKK